MARFGANVSTQALVKGPITGNKNRGYSMERLASGGLFIMMSRQMYITTREQTMALRKMQSPPPSIKNGSETRMFFFLLLV